MIPESQILWAVEIHAKGAIMATRQADMLERNRALLRNGEPIDYAMLDMNLTEAEAFERALQIKRFKREHRQPGDQPQPEKKEETQPHGQ